MKSSKAFIIIFLFCRIKVVCIIEIRILFMFSGQDLLAEGDFLLNSYNSKNSYVIQSNVISANEFG